MRGRKQFFLKKEPKNFLCAGPWAGHPTASGQVIAISSFVDHSQLAFYPILSSQPYSGLAV
jgi:hypothetical protein